MSSEQTSQVGPQQSTSIQSDSAVPSVADEGDTGKRRKPRRRLLVVGVLLVVAALFIGGGVTGYLLNNEWASRQSIPEPAVVTELVPAYGDGDSAVMPDVRGLSEAAARQLLTDAQVPVADVATSSEAAAGAVGTIIDQTPASGTRNPGKVNLVVSTEARMPAIAGANGQQLSVDLQKLGAQVDLQQRYQPGAQAGLVISSNPQPGSPLPGDVTLVVAEPGSSVYLATLSAVSSGCSTGKASLNGASFDNSLACSAGSREASLYEWVTKRAADQLTATVGIADDEDPGVARVEVFADGRRAASVLARYGSTVNLNAVISGALRISIAVSRVGDSTDSVSAILGDARLIGSATNVVKLTEK